ncbi:MAG: prepilin peptidase [Sporomusaceae bacterium]|nr:prepilin peptidase [Sporomusaceae bacterium]
MTFVFIALAGLIVGSFLTVCIYRIPLSQSIVFPRSYCPHCQKSLTPMELIPLLSYLLLAGQCRHCQQAIAFRYPAVELLTAILFAFCFAAWGWSSRLIAAWIFSSFLVVITWIDLEHQLVLNRVLVWFSLAGFFAGAGLGTPVLADMLIAAAGGGSCMLLIAVLSRGGMGGGDIKLTAALGIWLGWQGTLLALFLAFVFAGLTGVFLLLARIKGRKDMIPFAPFLCAGAFMALVYGAKLLTWYFGLTR